MSDPKQRPIALLLGYHVYCSWTGTLRRISKRKYLKLLVSEAQTHIFLTTQGRRRAAACQGNALAALSNVEGETGAGVLCFVNSIIDSVMFSKDQLETNLLKLFAHPENYNVFCNFHYFGGQLLRNMQMRQSSPLCVRFCIEHKLNNAHYKNSKWCTNWKILYWLISATVGYPGNTTCHVQVNRCFVQFNNKGVRFVRWIYRIFIKAFSDVKISSFVKWYFLGKKQAYWLRRFCFL